MTLSQSQVERRRVRPVSWKWFHAVTGTVVAALIVASWQGMRAYGQTEEKVMENTRNIDRLEALRLRDKVEIGNKLEKFGDILIEQHGAISGLKVSVDNLTDEVQRQRRDQEYRK